MLDQLIVIIEAVIDAAYKVAVVHVIVGRLGATPVPRSAVVTGAGVVD